MKVTPTIAPRSAEAGFSLIEVVMSITIIALTLIPLIAILVIGANNQREANTESRSVLIADSVLSTLKRSNAQAGIILRRGSSGDLSPTSATSDFIYDVSPNLDYFVAYADDGRAQAELTLADYQTGVSSSGTITSVGGSPEEVTLTEIVRVNIEPMSGTTGYSVGDTIGETQSLYRVEVSVEFPAQAPETERKSHVFNSYMTLDDTR